MLVRAVAGVDDGDFQMAGDEIRGAGRGVAHDETVRLHGVEIIGGVEKSLTLFQAGGFRLEIHGVRAEARGGGPETEARAGGIFEEGEDYGFAAESSKLFQGIALNLLKGFGLIQNEGEFVRTERFESEEIAKAVGQMGTRVIPGRPWD